MTKILSKLQHKVYCERIEELLQVVGNNTPENNKDFIELNFISDLVADYEEEQFSILELS